MTEIAQEDLIHFTIDGKKVTGKKGESIIAVADRYGIYIPRFCYHEKLSVVANCRMCLVEVEKAPKTLPACATQIMPDAKVFTKSKATIVSQKAVMEFLLVNHPLDCPICDKGGECELQDLAMGFGKTASAFKEPKRAVHDEDLGPLVATDMTRCIHCTRCIRFGTEVAGIPELGATGRGEDMRIETYLSKGLNSELSGNCIDVCPVGALTSRPFRYRGRSWGFTQHKAYATHDCIGSHTTIQTIAKGYDQKTEIMRVLPRKNEALNQVWLSDRDRFSYLGLRHSERLTEPKLKRNGVWQTISWEEALNEVADRTMKTIKSHGEQSCGFYATPNTTLEEGYLLGKIAQQLGCRNIDHRIHLQDTRQQVNPDVFTTLRSLEDLATKKTLVLLGSYIRHEQPVASIRVREASLAGAEVWSVNPEAYDWNFPVAENIVVAHDAMIKWVAQVLKSVLKLKKQVVDPAWKALLQDIRSNKQSDALAKKLDAKSGFILGEYAQSLSHSSLLLKLVDYLARLTGADKLLLTPGCNARGLYQVGVTPFTQPQKPGLCLKKAMEKPKKMIWLHQFEAEFDVANPGRTLKSLEDTESVVCFSSFETETMRNYADILIPLTPTSEMSGTIINALGDKQAFQASQEHLGQSKPGWKCYRVLGTLLGLNGFVFRAIDELQKEIQAHIEECGRNEHEYRSTDDLSWPEVPENPHWLHRIGNKPMYRVDGVVRRSTPLQEACKHKSLVVRMHAKTAKELKLDQRNKLRFRMEKKSFCFPLLLDDKVSEGCIVIPAGLPEASALGGVSDWVEILV